MIEISNPHRSIQNSSPVRLEIVLARHGDYGIILGVFWIRFVLGVEKNIENN